MARTKEPLLQPRLRIVCADEIALGPGKAQLLEFIGETGSIAESAKRMRMSYMRAWTMVRTMNQQFAAPLVSASRGGKDRGGAALTATGREVLRWYRVMELRCHEAAADAWDQLRKRLRGARGNK